MLRRSLMGHELSLSRSIRSRRTKLGGYFLLFAETDWKLSTRLLWPLVFDKVRRLLSSGATST